MSEYIYSINDIFKFPVGSVFQDEDGNLHKIFQDKEYYSKTFKHSIVTEKLIKGKFRLAKSGWVYDTLGE